MQFLIEARKPFPKFAINVGFHFPFPKLETFWKLKPSNGGVLMSP